MIIISIIYYVHQCIKFNVLLCFSVDGLIKVFLPETDEQSQICVTNDEHLQIEGPELNANIPTTSTNTTKCQTHQKENEEPNIGDNNPK